MEVFDDETKHFQTNTMSEREGSPKNAICRTETQKRRRYEKFARED